jgi:CubicO group peptidase (beta-lactamase class C family)
MVYDDDFGYTVDVDPEAWDGWRDYVLRGEVNDGNAFHTHSGVAGHAGLFSTAEELYRLASLLLTAGRYNEMQLFTADTIGTFLTLDRFGHGLGFMMDAGSLHAAELPDGSFGHTGFTGTNFVIIPEKDLIIILLTNRQHFGVDEDGYYPDLRELRSGVIKVIIDGVAEMAI